jgi:hypothetical protein
MPFASPGRTRSTWNKIVNDMVDSQGEVADQALAI